MTWDVALILGIDGLANGAVYLLAGLGLVLIFSVTRVVFVPFGDIAAFAALTLAAFETGRLPPTIGLVLMLAALAVLTEVGSLVRRRECARMPKAIAGLGRCCRRCRACWPGLAARPGMPAAVQIAVTVLLVVPIAPLLARVVFQPIADASVLVLLIVSLALHFLLSGLGLLFFGPEGSRTSPLASGTLTLGDGFTVSGQVVLMVASAIVLSGLFFLVFERTVAGKALRATAVNRVGARLVGIRPARTALLAYGCASLLAGLIGVLIAPVTTMYYDSGFIIGLKAFVAAIIGGLVSYPMTAIGALAVGAGRELRLVLERRAEGRDRVQPADPGADAALVPGDARRKRKKTRWTNETAAPERSRCWIGRGRRSALALAPLLPAISRSRCSTTSASARWSRSGLVLLTGIGGATSFGQAAFVGIAAYATAWLTTAQGLSPWLGLAVRARCSPACRRSPSAC